MLSENNIKKNSWLSNKYLVAGAMTTLLLIIFWVVLIILKNKSNTEPSTTQTENTPAKTEVAAQTNSNNVSTIPIVNPNEMRTTNTAAAGEIDSAIDNVPTELGADDAADFSDSSLDEISL